jgi:hypothetical protein
MAVGKAFPALWQAQRTGNPRPRPPPTSRPNPYNLFICWYLQGAKARLCGPGDPRMGACARQTVCWSIHNPDSSHRNMRGSPGKFRRGCPPTAHAAARGEMRERLHFLAVRVGFRRVCAILFCVENVGERLRRLNRGISE